jgi:hypothetical protein
MMTPDQIREFIQDGEWASITVELRPSSNKTPTGAPQPFYCSRLFKYSEPDHFECTVINFSDPNGKVPMVKIHIKGLNLWRGEHPIAKGAYNVDYVADEAYEITPLHQGFADAANRFTASGLNHWEIGVAQDVQAKPFPLFGLIEGQTYVDYDLIYVYDGMLVNESKHVDGRAFDKPEGRPTNLQIPLIRKSQT